MPRLSSSFSLFLCLFLSASSFAGSDISPVALNWHPAAMIPFGIRVLACAGLPEGPTQRRLGGIMRLADVTTKIVTSSFRLSDSGGTEMSFIVSMMLLIGVDWTDRFLSVVRRFSCAGSALCGRKTCAGEKGRKYKGGKIQINPIELLAKWFLPDNSRDFFPPATWNNLIEGDGWIQPSALSRGTTCRIPFVSCPL